MPLSLQWWNATLRWFFETWTAHLNECCQCGTSLRLFPWDDGDGCELFSFAFAASIWAGLFGICREWRSRMSEIRGWASLPSQKIKRVGKLARQTGEEGGRSSSWLKGERLPWRLFHFRWTWTTWFVALAARKGEKTDNSDLQCDSQVPIRPNAKKVNNYMTNNNEKAELCTNHNYRSFA